LTSLAFPFEGDDIFPFTSSTGAAVHPTAPPPPPPFSRNRARRARFPDEGAHAHRAFSCGLGPHGPLASVIPFVVIHVIRSYSLQYQ
jgi:hypothetical protein